jgi:hypothetical protein
LFPDAKINEPFLLHYGLDHVIITPNGLTVFARK